jgi:hypothetical protein
MAIPSAAEQALGRPARGAFLNSTGAINAHRSPNEPILVDHRVAPPDLDLGFLEHLYRERIERPEWPWSANQRAAFATDRC